MQNKGNTKPPLIPSRNPPYIVPRFNIPMTQPAKQWSTSYPSKPQQFSRTLLLRPKGQFRVRLARNTRLPNLKAVYFRPQRSMRSTKKTQRGKIFQNCHDEKIGPEIKQERGKSISPKQTRKSVNLPIVRRLSLGGTNFNFKKPKINLPVVVASQVTSKKDTFTSDGFKMPMTQVPTSSGKKIMPNTDLKTFLNNHKKRVITVSECFSVNIPTKKVSLNKKCHKIDYPTISWLDFSKEVNEKDKKMDQQLSDEESEEEEENFEPYDYKDPFIDDTDLVGLNPNLVTETPGFFAFKGNEVPLIRLKEAMHEGREDLEEESIPSELISKLDKISFPKEIDFSIYLVKNYVNGQNSFKLNQKTVEERIQTCIELMKKQKFKYKNFKDGMHVEQKLREIRHKAFKRFEFNNEEKAAKTLFIEEEVKEIFRQWKAKKLNKNKKKILAMISKLKNDTECLKSKIATLLKTDIESLICLKRYDEKKYFLDDKNPCFVEINGAFKQKKFSAKELKSIFDFFKPKLVHNYESVLRYFPVEIIIDSEEYKGEPKKLESKVAKGIKINDKYAADNPGKKGLACNKNEISKKTENKDVSYKVPDEKNASKTLARKIIEIKDNNDFENSLAILDNKTGENINQSKSDERKGKKKGENKASQKIKIVRKINIKDKSNKTTDKSSKKKTKINEKEKGDEKEEALIDLTQESDEKDTKNINPK